MNIDVNIVIITAMTIMIKFWTQYNETIIEFNRLEAETFDFVSSSSSPSFLWFCHFTWTSCKRINEIHTLTPVTSVKRAGNEYSTMGTLKSYSLLSTHVHTYRMNSSVITNIIVRCSCFGLTSYTIMFFILCHLN